MHGTKSMCLQLGIQWKSMFEFYHWLSICWFVHRRVGCYNDYQFWCFNYCWGCCRFSWNINYWYFCINVNRISIFSHSICSKLPIKSRKYFYNIEWISMWNLFDWSGSRRIDIDVWSLLFFNFCGIDWSIDFGRPEFNTTILGVSNWNNINHSCQFPNRLC